VLAAADEGDRESARLAARQPLYEAYRIARGLPALPLLHAVVDLASRARVPLPVADEAATGEPPAAEQLVAVGPGRLPSRQAVPVGPGPSPDGSPDAGRELARQIDDLVIAALRRAPVDAYGLSPREHEVLVILAEGRTDRDIAARLFISERTVHVHVRRILAKLGVSSRTEAAGVAIRQGLVPSTVPLPAGSVGPRQRAGGMT
jgi:DNA-binding CsgD family transcriptional regulator